MLIADLGVLALFGEARARRARSPVDMQAKVSVMLPAANPAAARVLESLGASTINLPTDLTLAQIAAIRAAVDVPLDVYVEAPDNVGGFVRLHEIPELIRVAAPVYVKFGLRNAPDVYPAGSHLESTTVALSRERVRRARLGLELLARSGYEPTTSELGAAGLAVPASQIRPEGELMARPVTLFTGQWADLPLRRRWRRSAPAWGFDGLELACWGDHFEVDKALADDAYARGRRDAARSVTGLDVWAIGAHLVGQAVCDRIDERHRAILPPEVYGDGDPEGVRNRAAERMKDTARAAARLGVTQVNGFTGSSIWHLIYSFPPNDFDEIERGYSEFAERWGPILDVFDTEGVRFGLEVHPTEIAYDFVTTRKTLEAIGNREAFGINLDPSHFAHQFLDTAQFALRVRRPHLPRARQGLAQAPRRAALDPQLAPQLR